jgi:hypothetical protein
MDVDRLGTSQLQGAWRPVGTTTEGLVLVNDDEDAPVTVLVGPGGEVGAEFPGIALSVGWGGAAILRPERTLAVTDAGLTQPRPVDRPGEGAWVPVGGPVVPSDSPPVVTGTNRFLVGLSDGSDPSLGGDLVMVDGSGMTATLGSFPGRPPGVVVARRGLGGGVRRIGGDPDPDRRRRPGPAR